MTINDSHPDTDELQRYADGEIDAMRDASLVRHVADCEVCQREVEQTRRTSAVLAMASKPPADMLARMKARRAAGERVMLPVDNMEAAPRRDTVPARPRVLQPRQWRAPQWGLAIAASVIFVVAVDTMVMRQKQTGSTLVDSALLAWSQLPAAMQQERWTSTSRAIEQMRAAFASSMTVRESADRIVISMSDSAFSSAALTPRARDDLRELGALLAQQPAYRVHVLSAATAEPRRQAAREALVEAGVAPERITASTTDVASAPVVAVVVLRPDSQK